MANLSTFPNQIDQFILLQDLPASLYVDAQTLQQLKALTNPTPEQITQINNLLTELAPYYISVQTFNKFQDCLINMESFTLETFLNYYKYCGVYNPLTTYKIFNSVRYNGCTYISLKQQTGVQPTDDGVNWFQNSSNGESYALNIIGSVGTVIYDNTGANPSPSMSALSCALYANGVQVTPTTYSWTTPSSNSMLSGSSTSATFTPIIASNFNPTFGNNTVTLTLTYQDQTFIQYYPIAITKVGNTGANGQNGLGLTYIGNYNAGTTYYIGNAFNWNNSVYYATNTAPAGTEPTNTSYFQLFLSNTGIVIQATMPTSPYVNEIWVDTSTTANVMKYWDGSQWNVCGNMAKNISIADVGNIITATNVEDALQEIKTQADSTKNKVGSTTLQTTAQNLSDAINENANKIGILNTDFNSHKADNVNHIPYAVATGSANTYAVTLNPVPTAYIDGMAICVKINVASTGASTLNVNGLGAKTIKDSLGNAITSGGLKANTPYTLRYESISSSFIVQGKGGGGNTIASHVLAGETCTVDTGQIVGTMPNLSGNWQSTTFKGNYNFGSYYGVLAQIPNGFSDGGANTYTLVGDANFVPANILSGKSIFGVEGTATVSSLGGKRYASGNSVSTDSSGYLTISGLSFTPGTIFMWMPGRTDQVTFYNVNVSASGKFIIGSTNGVIGYIAGEYVGAGGFKLRFSNITYQITLNWLAIE